MFSIKKLFPAVLPALLFASCFAAINGAVGEGASADLRLRVSLGPRTAALIHTLRSFAGEANNTPILDGDAISNSMAAAPGIRSFSLKNSGPHTLDGTISLSNAGDFLSSGAANPSGGSRFITYTEERDAASIVVTLDKNTAPELISRLSAEAGGYLEALMAPAVTGERMTAREYLDLVASIYGRPLSDEIAAAMIQGKIDFPRPVKAVRGGTFSGKQAVFDIPLLDILVLETPLRYEVSW